MKGKAKSVFDSLWFNLIMSVVAVGALVDSVMSESYVFMVLWIVLVFHFVREVVRKK